MNKIILIITRQKEIPLIQLIIKSDTGWFPSTFIPNGYFPRWGQYDHYNVCKIFLL